MTYTKPWPKRPETINGLPVIAASKSGRGFHSPGTRDGWIVVVQREHELHPYITAVLFEDDTEWVWGHYHATAREAFIDFDARVEKGY